MNKTTPKRRPTILDVARLAGVSQTTVSFIINDKPDASISRETRQRVQHAIGALGYQPNAMAQRLRRSTSDVIGFVTDEIATTPFAGQIIRGAQAAAWARKKILLITNTDKNPDLERDAFERMAEHRVEGILYSTMTHRPVPVPTSSGDIPIVLVNCYSETGALPAVVPDEVRGGYDATCVLLAKNHRRIGFITSIHALPATTGRLAGYRQALTEQAVPFDSRLVVAADAQGGGGYTATYELMTRSDRPTALFCYNDRTAMGAYLALAHLGLRIPEDVAIVGFDNQEIIAAQLTPPLSTVALPHYDLGWIGADLLLNTIEGIQADQPTTRLIHCPVVHRSSV